jgi:hypothetical protein
VVNRLPPENLLLWIPTPKLLLRVLRSETMQLRAAIAVIVNFLLIAALIIYGFRLFAEYHARGRWAKNVTSLLAGLGLMILAAALLLTPTNAAVLAEISHTKIARVLLWASNTLLLAAIAAFGVITYSRPLRLWHERKIERDLKRELPKIP